MIEWTASDGRRGRLTGPGRPRATATDPVQAPAVKAPSAKAAEEDDGGIIGLGLFDDAATAPASAKVVDADQPASSDWTQEQDKKLLELKNDNKPWADIATELNKKEYECREHFKQIKPTDWKPNNGKGENDGKQKQGKQKVAKKQNSEHGGDSKSEDTKDTGAFDNNETNGWGVSGNATDWNSGANNNDAGGFKEDSANWGAGGGGSYGNWDNSNNNGGQNSWENAAGGNGAGDTSNNYAWDKPANDTPKVETSGDAPTKDTKEPSDKARSHSGSKSHSHRDPEKAAASAPKEYELKPDTTFSANDLRLIAKILQQDCSMVWNRVSWRFKDKTGRNLHPDVFEKKITGSIEDRGSEHGRK